ncbi:squalene/phytoene synthase family protein [Candidatus Saccharibacteria bacterium]|nr:squalene/phytoene synthase family protein [Candidatus Saccharibacteria bacterium]
MCKASYKACQLITTSYSTSFGLSITLFDSVLRPHIYAIYGLVRIADEIVDTYTGPDRRQLLDDLEAQTKAAITSGYSTNPIVHSFALTARQYDIGFGLISPFFKSMRMDITPKTFDQKLYDNYIYGSAEVVGLMCLKVFTADKKLYESLAGGAGKLGAAYQKVNFLRDIAADAEGLGRWYFPISSYADFDEKTKSLITKDIEEDFAAAKKAIIDLPASSRKAVELSYVYYSQLLKKIKATPAKTLRLKRIRINNVQKTALFMQVKSGKYHV